MGGVKERHKPQNIATQPWLSTLFHSEFHQTHCFSSAFLLDLSLGILNFGPRLHSETGQNPPEQLPINTMRDLPFPKSVSRTLRFALCLALAIALWSPIPSALAQDGLTVREVEVQFAGPATVSKERILANMRTTVGQPYTQQVVEDDIRNLYLSGEISNVRIFREGTQGGVKVVVIVQTRPVLGEVIIEGNDLYSTRRLRRELESKVGSTLNEEQLELDRQKIVKYYTDRGFNEIDVQYKVELDESRGSAVVVFAVYEGEKAIVRRIDFTGNEGVSTRELRKAITTRPANILSFINKSGRFTDQQIQEDIEEIRSTLQNNGYIDARVLDVQFDRISNKRVDITFVIEEGVQYTISELRLEGNTVFTPEEIRTKLSMEEGSVYSPEKMRNDLKAVREMYGILGYADFIMVPEGYPSGTNTVQITYNIDEGMPSTVGLVNIEGNIKTKDKVIRRELAVAPGDTFNTVLVDASKERLNNLGYFSRVETIPSDTMVPGEKDLNVFVEEKRTGSLNFGLGFSSIDSLTGFVELTQSNFDIGNWPSFYGGGQRFRVRGQYGLERADFILSLTEPWFLDYQWSLGGELFYNDLDYFSDEYSQRSLGFSILNQIPIGKFMSAGLQYKLEEINIYDVSPFASLQIQAERGSRSRSALQAFWTLDTRDSVFLTRRGQKIEISPYVAGVFLGGQTEIYGLNIEASQFFALPFDMILQLNGQLAAVDNWGGGQFVPIFDRLFLGGANNLRGFDFREVGPKDIFGEPTGGNSLARATIELTFPLIERVRGAVFYDWGVVNSNAWDFSTANYNDDFGFGLRLDLPIGPIRLDYGIPITSDRFNGGSGKFNFNVGYQF